MFVSPQAEGTMAIDSKTKNGVPLFFRHQGYHPLLDLYPEGITVNPKFWVQFSKRLVDAVWGASEEICGGAAHRFLGDLLRAECRSFRQEKEPPSWVIRRSLLTWLQFISGPLEKTLTSILKGKCFSNVLMWKQICHTFQLWVLKTRNHWLCGLLFIAQNCSS
jgi:hypothetical protein